MNKQRAISILKITVTALIVVFSIYFSIWKVDFSELGHSFRTANYWYALIIIIPIVLSHYVRAVRWKIILERIHPNVRTGNLFAGVMIGYFMNNLIPRSGELVRPWFTAREEKETTYSSLLGSIVVERFIDTVALLIMIAVILLMDKHLFDGFEEVGVNADVIRPIIYMAILLGTGFIVIAPSKAGLWVAETASRPLDWMARRFGIAKFSRIRASLLDMFRKLQLGFGAVRSPRQLVRVTLHTALLYSLYMAPLWIMFNAFPSGANPEVTLFAALEIYAITALGYAVAPTPGAFGVFHVTARIALMKFAAFTYADAVAYATLTHFVNYCVPIVFGIYYLVTSNMSFGSLMRPVTVVIRARERTNHRSNSHYHQNRHVHRSPLHAAHSPLRAYSFQPYHRRPHDDMVVAQGRNDSFRRTRLPAAAGAGSRTRDHRRLLRTTGGPCI